ncbi:Sulfatase, partial [Ruminococcaceae bacterium YRB3002]
SISINLLPILMTVINIISSEIYTKGQPFKDKIVLYLSAAIFLVLLYDSPSGLVFYWTFNNVFALVKNVFCRYVVPKGIRSKGFKDLSNTDQMVFWSGMVYMSVLIGLMAPGDIIVSAPEDFIHLLKMNNPTEYVYNTLFVAVGFYIVWIGIYYLLSPDKWKKVFTYLTLVMVVCSTCDYFIYSSDMGFVSPELVFTDVAVSYSSDVLVITTIAVVIIGAVFAFLHKLMPRVTSILVIAGVIALTIMGSINMVSIDKTYRRICDDGCNSEVMNISLTKTGRNVIVLMMDRAISGYVPYFIQEDPSLIDAFDGFVYYPNTIAFGGHTNISAPALFGGYEYTPEQLNSRDKLTLKEKHNEALLVMPVIFSNEGYHSTVVDMPYVNYSSLYQTSIFDERDGINAYVSSFVASDYVGAVDEQLDAVRYRNFFMYSVLKATPPILHRLIYDGGKYHSLNKSWFITEKGSFHFPLSHSEEKRSEGVNPDFLTSYEVLTGLTDVTTCGDVDNQFVIICNDVTHSPMQLQMPGYELSDKVDNTDYFSDIPDGIRLEKYMQIAHYQVNMAAFLALGDWFDQLRASGVWDNTRVIIVSDHGSSLDQFDSLIFEDIMMDAEEINSLLMVKDFGSRGFTISDEYMTIADVPAIATSGLIDNPVNPFTSNVISNTDKTASPQKIYMPYLWRIQDNNGNRFSTGNWYSVHDNIFDRNNWEYLGEY